MGSHWSWHFPYPIWGAKWPSTLTLWDSFKIQYSMVLKIHPVSQCAFRKTMKCEFHRSTTCHQRSILSKLKGIIDWSCCHGCLVDLATLQVATVAWMQHIERQGRQSLQVRGFWCNSTRRWGMQHSAGGAFPFCRSNPWLGLWPPAAFRWCGCPPTWLRLAIQFRKFRKDPKQAPKLYVLYALCISMTWWCCCGSCCSSWHHPPFPWWGKTRIVASLAAAGERETPQPVAVPRGDGPPVVMGRRQWRWVAWWNGCMMYPARMHLVTKEKKANVVVLNSVTRLDWKFVGRNLAVGSSRLARKDR